MKRCFKHIVFLVFTFLLFIPSNGQGHIEFLKNKKKQKLSFELINNLIIIPVSINGKKLSFILDSGARNTILFGATNSDSLVLNEQMKTKIRGLGEGNSVNAIVSKNNRLKIKNLYGYNQKVYVILDDKFDLSLKMGKPIHGIIGYELFKDFVVEINYRTRKLIFYDVANYKPPESKKFKEFSLSFHKDKPYIDASSQLADSATHKTKLLIDTGCSDALWFFENPNTGMEVKGKYFIDYLGEGLNGSIEGKRSKIKSFSLGDFKFTNITTAFLDSTSTSHARTFRARDGSIGSRFLERFHVILDYSNQKMYLKKAKSFDKEFRYNRAGLGVAYHKDAKVLHVEKNQHQKIVISERVSETNNTLFEITYEYKLKRLFYVYYVRTNSPAGNAGLKVGDIIHTINGKNAYEFSLEEIINFFYGEKGEMLTIIVERNGGHFNYKLTLEEPL